MNLKVEYLPIGDLRPYERNANKHNKRSISAIKASIRDFGMCDPIGIWSEKNIVVEGHGRLQALREMGYDETPVIRLDFLTDEQRRAYAIAHNKTAEFSKWDFDILDAELKDICNIDMGDFDLQIKSDDDSSYYGDERERTYDKYKLNMMDNTELTNSFWQMPVIENDGCIPERLIGFNYAKTSEDNKAGIHFYLDDYQFERIWKKPEKYVQTLKKFECVLTPDFSLYSDMPMPLKIYNVYRSRAVGAYLQQRGIKVIPTVSWADTDTFRFCFEGISKNSIVSISTIGVKRDASARETWERGVDEMIKRIEPSAILIYGGKINYNFGDMRIKYYGNEVLQNWRIATKGESECG